MKYNDLINELFDLLDENETIKRLKELKKELEKDEKLKEEIENYRENKTISSKKKLYENPNYIEYLKLESMVSFFLQDMKNKFNSLTNRKCFHESD